jgi:hypothetical protein
MERFVKLERLPEGFAFPAQFADRIRYDPTEHRLRFEGFMSKADFDKLYFLIEDWSYRRALEELFRLSTVEDVNPTRLLGRLKAVLSTMRLG